MVSQRLMIKFICVQLFSPPDRLLMSTFTLSPSVKQVISVRFTQLTSVSEDKVELPFIVVDVKIYFVAILKVLRL